MQNGSENKKIKNEIEGKGMLCTSPPDIPIPPGLGFFLRACRKQTSCGGYALTIMHSLLR